MDSTERVKYSFEGDASSLQNATKQALKSLSKYESTIKGKVASDNVNVGAKTFSGFSKATKTAISQFGTLFKFFKKTENSMAAAFTPDTASIIAAGKQIDTVLSKLSDPKKLTGRGLSSLTKQLNDANKLIEKAVTKATRLDASFGQIPDLKPKMRNADAELEEMLGRPIKRASESAQVFFEELKKKIATTQAAIKRSTEANVHEYTEAGKRINALKFAQDVDSGANLSGKSALESAKVFAADKSIYSSNPIVATFQKISAKVGMLGGEIRQKVHKLGESFSAITPKLQSFKDHAIGLKNKAAPAIKALGNAFKHVVSATGKAVSSIKKLVGFVSSLIGKLRKAAKAASNFASRLTHIGKSAKGAFHGMRLFRNMLIGKAISSSVKSAISAAENLNLFKVAMGDATEEGLKFVEQMQEVYGMDPNNLYRTIGYFAQLTQASGMAEKSSSKLSMSLTKAANDIASLLNVPIERVNEDLASGLQGMTRAVRKYGMDIRATTIQQTAYSLGITRNVAAMSEADRQGLRFITMMRQASAAIKQQDNDTKRAAGTMGDFANTIEQPANQLRIFKEQITQLGRAIGNFILVPVRTAIAYINGFVMALRTAINFVAGLLGVLKEDTDSGVNDKLEDTQNNIEGIGGAAGSAAKKLKDLVAPFDELNILNREANTGGGGGGGLLNGALDPAIEDAIEDMELTLENIQMKANKVRDSLLEFFGFTVKDGKITAFDSDKFWEGLELSRGAAVKLAKDVTNKIKKALNAVSPDTIGTAVGQLVDAAIAFAATIVTDTPWSELSSKLTSNLISAIGEIDFKDIGVLVAAKYNIMLELLSGIVSSLNEVNSSTGMSGWETLGAKFADMVMGAFESINWENAGHTVQSLITGIYEFIITALSNVSWDDIGKDIATFVNGIDWKNLFNNLLNIFLLLAQGIATSFGEFWKEADPDTKLALLGAGMLLMIGPLKTIIGKVGALTGAYRHKNTALTKQNELEQTAATQLSGSLAPALGIAAGAATMLAGNFVGVNEQLADAKTELNDTQTATADLQTALSTFNESPIKTFCGNIVSAFGSVEDSIRDCIREFRNFKQEFGDNSKSESQSKPKSPGFGHKTDWGKAFTSGLWPMLPSIIGGVAGSGFGMPLPMFASGGIVTSPTLAMIGEGHYDEAVIPLGNSPQMNELVGRIAAANNSDQIVDAIYKLIDVVDTKDTSVYIGDEDIGYSYDRYQKKRGMRVNSGAFANAY